MSAIDPSKTSKNNNTTAFLTSLAVNGGLLLVEVGAFIILKQRLWRIYSPRTVLPPPEYVFSYGSLEIHTNIPQGNVPKNFHLVFGNGCLLSSLHLQKIS